MSEFAVQVAEHGLATLHFASLNPQGPIKQHFPKLHIHAYSAFNLALGLSFELRQSALRLGRSLTLSGLLSLFDGHWEVTKFEIVLRLLPPGHLAI